jgi:hypothetical protein
MRKLILATALLLLAVPPVVAQITLPTTYPNDIPGPTLFRKSAVYQMGAPRTGAAIPARGFLSGPLYRMNTSLLSKTSGAKSATYVLPAYSLVTSGHALRIRIFGTTAANANTKQVQFVFGGTTITLLNAASNAKDFYADIEVTRTGTNTQQISVAGYSNGVLFNALSATATEAETSAINIKVNLPTATADNDTAVTSFSVSGESG